MRRWADDIDTWLMPRLRARYRIRPAAAQVALAALPESWPASAGSARSLVHSMLNDQMPRRRPAQLDAPDQHRPAYDMPDRGLARRFRALLRHRRLRAADGPARRCINRSRPAPLAAGDSAERQSCCATMLLACSRGDLASVPTLIARARHAEPARSIRP